MTAVAYELANTGDDEYERLGLREAELFANEPFDDGLLGVEAYEVEDVGRRNILAGRAALAGFTKDFHTDRIMPKYGARMVLPQVFVGPDNYIG